MTYWLIPFTLPLVLQGWIVAALAFCFGIWGRARFAQGILVCEWRPWFAARWPFVTTIAYAMGARAGGPLYATWSHEIVHVRQSEDLVLTALIIGGIVAIWQPWLGLGIYLSGGPLWQLPGFLSALPRYRRLGKSLGLKGWETMYYGSEHERSAYAQTQVGRWPIS